MRKTLIGTIIVLASLTPFAVGAYTVYHDPTVGVPFQDAQEAAFLAATGPLTMIHFDDLASNTVLVGNEYAGLGALFSHPGGFQVRALGDNDNFTPRSAPNSLFPYGGGGVDERIQMNLTTPQYAVGLWIIDTEYATPGFTETLDFYDAADQLIYSLAYPYYNATTGSPDANWFVGLVSDTPIAKVVLNEGATEPILEDVGWDNVYFGVPEPTAFGLLALGAVALMRRRA